MPCDESREILFEPSLSFHGVLPDMATKNSNTTKSTGNRVGRPTNASKRAAIQSQQSLLIDTAMAAASAAAKAALGIVDDGVTTISQPQASQSNTGNTSTASKSQASTSTAKKSPGRKVQADSALSLTRQFYADNLKASTPLSRAEFVKAATAKFGYAKETANTYVSNIEKEGGYKLVRRGSNTSARGGRARTQKANTQATGTDG